MILSLEGVRFSYPGRPVLDEIVFSVQKGQVLAVLGPNGSGKTTLLKCINRILSPSGGVVLVDEVPVSKLSRNALARKIGYVEQQRAGSRATVFNTVLLGRKPYIRWDVTGEDMQIAETALRVLGLSDHSMRFLDELSGGELQKVVIARALAQEPDILLMDEPTSSLDLKNQLEVLDVITRITRDRQIAAVVTMHDLNLALRLADRFIVLKGGRIFAVGGEEVITPEMIEAVYAVRVEIASHNGSRVVVPL